jgi:hypothetical protein
MYRALEPIVLNEITSLVAVCHANIWRGFNETVTADIKRQQRPIVGRDIR